MLSLKLNELGFVGFLECNAQGCMGNNAKAAIDQIYLLEYNAWLETRAYREKYGNK